MARRTGVTVEQTRAELLDAAARVFALKGYDGAAISDITNESGLSSGAIYAHYSSKAALFLAVVQEHGRRDFRELFGFEEPQDAAEATDFAGQIPTYFARVGAAFASRPPGDTELMLEAIVSSRRHPEVAELVTSWVSENESMLAEAIRAGQAAGLLNPDAGADAVSRFVFMVTLGARLVAILDLPSVDPEEWTSVIEQLSELLRAPEARQPRN